MRNEKYTISGPDLLSAGPCSEKNVGALQPSFPGEKLATFLLVIILRVTVYVSAVSSPQNPGDLFLLITLISLGDRPFFRRAKICRSFCGAPFCGAPVRPNNENPYLWSNRRNFRVLKEIGAEEHDGNVRF